MSYFGLTATDLQNALSVAKVTALYDDGNGLLNSAALTENIDRAEQELISWIIASYGYPLPAAFATEPILKYCALDFLIGFSIERMPEYAKQAGIGTKENYFLRATERALRILSGIQNPLTAP